MAPAAQPRQPGNVNSLVGVGNMARKQTVVTRRANGTATRTSKAQTRQEIEQAVAQRAPRKVASKARGPVEFDGVELIFTLTKETAGTFRYDCTTQSGKPFAFYLLKEVLPANVEMPDEVVISVIPNA